MANADIIRGVYEAFGRGDVNHILNQLDPAVEWGSTSVATEVPWLGWRKGVEAVRGFFTHVESGITITLFRPELFVEQGDNVAVKLRIEGTIKKTGQAAKFDTIHLWQLKAGKIVCYQQFDDTAAVRDSWRG